MMKFMKRKRRRGAAVWGMLLLSVIAAAAARELPAAPEDQPRPAKLVTGGWNPVVKEEVYSQGEKESEEASPEGRQLFPNFPARGNRQFQDFQQSQPRRQQQTAQKNVYANMRVVPPNPGVPPHTTAAYDNRRVVNRGQRPTESRVQPRVVRLPPQYTKLSSFENLKTATAGPAPALSEILVNKREEEGGAAAAAAAEERESGRSQQHDRPHAHRVPDYSIGNSNRRPVNRRVDAEGIAVRRRQYNPQVVTRAPVAISGGTPTWTPRPLAPFTTVRARRRPGSRVVGAKGANSRLNTEYFSLPSPRPTPGGFVSSTPKSSRVRVVKNLVKVQKGKSGAEHIQVINTTTIDLCASNSDIECGGGGGEVIRAGRNATGSSPSTFGDIGAVLPFLEHIRDEIWVIPVLSSTALLVMFLLIFEIYLIAKSCTSNPSRRHLFLGQILLLGLVLCCCMAVTLCLKPTVTTCAVLRVGVGLSYTVIYSTLLVKLVFLISLNSGVYLPAMYQCLLLVFAISIQLVIGIQWLISSPTEVGEVTSDDGSATYLTCGVEFKQQLMGLLYVHFLVVVVVILSFKSRGVRENYREAMYIGLTMAFTVLIFLIWMGSGYFLEPMWVDLTVACGLVGCSAITFVVMFMPKGRQLSAMGRDGVYSEDRADVVYTGSSTQSTASGGTPSPSFFPIKPGKLVEQFKGDDSTMPPPPRKHSYPPPPPPPKAAPFDERGRSSRNYRPRNHAASHQQQHGYHHRRNASQDSSFESGSMSNLVGTTMGNHGTTDHHLHRGMSYNPRIGLGAATPNIFRGDDPAASPPSRWRRSRSSPAVAHNFNIGGRWQQAVGGSGWQLADIPGEQPRHQQPPGNFHSSFHDLHAANERRASRHDLSELRDLLRQEDARSLRSTRTTATNRGRERERKWPPVGGSSAAMSADEMGMRRSSSKGFLRHRHDGSPTTLCKRCSVAAETEVANPLFRY